MYDLRIKRNDLEFNLKKLKSAKFDPTVSHEYSILLLEKEREILKKLQFYENYIRIGGKLENGQEIYTKER